MSIYYQDEHATLFHGNSLEVLKSMPDESVHAVVTDPPYGLSNTTPAQVAECLREWAPGNTTFVPAKRGGFMGKDWDSFVPPPAVWAECLRVLKPGGHLLAFAGSRTQDLMGMSVRMAGFDIRDSFAWLYGSGFPKSMDVSKAIDKGTGQNKARQYEFTAWMRSTGITAREIDEATGTAMGGHYLTDQSQPAIATADLFDKLRPLLPEVPERIERLVAERTGIEWTDYVKREVVGKGTSGKTYGMGGLRGIETSSGQYDVTAPATSEAEQWEGWGTALKPAFEPVIIARKPFTGTVAANVLEHGTGAINIDASRIGERFPANVLLDESQAAVLDEQASTARFFYCAKSPKSERPKVDGVAHPTVKPLTLMRYLVRMVTPPGGTVLDPFTGSGTTLEAAKIEGFRSIGIEITNDYLPLIRQRLERSTVDPHAPGQPKPDAEPEVLPQPPAQEEHLSLLDLLEAP